MRRQFASWMKDYDQTHKTTGNRRTHIVGIPLITTALLSLLNHAVVFETGSFIKGSLALMLFAVVSVFYLVSDFKTGLRMMAFNGIWFMVGLTLSLPVVAAFFVVGWALQLYGHSHYERNRPALVQNLIHILIGPVWIQHYLTHPKAYLLKRSR